MELRFSEDPNSFAVTLCQTASRAGSVLEPIFSEILVGLLTLTLFSRRILVFADELPVAPDFLVQL